MKGYKVFNPDWTCRGFQYRVGREYKHNGRIEMCISGFHFCIKAQDCFNYYGFDSKNKVAEVEAIGKVLTHDNDSKVCTNHIKIIREMSWYDVLCVVNTGKDNTGYKNSGDCNSGNYNSGDKNSGDCNSGNYNSGNYNSGDKNSGDCNSGNYNSGDWNACNNSSGVFCTEDPKILLFDKPTQMTLTEWRRTEAYRLLSRINPAEWVYWDDMSDNEKKEHPKAYVCDGYLKIYRYKETWDSFTDKEKSVIKAIPNFDAEKFEKITGIKV